MTATNEMKHPSDHWKLPCLLTDVPFSDYLNIPAASSHTLWDLINESPLHVKQKPVKIIKAMTLGTLLHALLLEPEKAGDSIAIKPADAAKNSNYGKRQLYDWLQKITNKDSIAGIDLPEGKMLSARISELEPFLEELINSSEILVCTQDQYEDAMRMRDSVLTKDIGRIIFNEGIAEATLLAFDPETRVFCKGRIDWIPAGHNVICDVKTTVSASFDDFSRHCARYGYHAQAAFYRWLYALVEDTAIPTFLHVVVENNPPFDCAFYEFDETALKAGDNRIRRALKIWEKCERSNYWPGIGYDFSQQEYTIQPLSLPKWAI